MSILENLINSFTDTAGTDSDSVEHPCSNCPGSCSIAPNACDVCSPYKKKLIDTIYKVEHLEDFLAQYEVVSEVSSGPVTCPHCGGNSDNPYICDFCGSKLSEGSGKIQVAAASDIPNPVLEAQNIIFERYDAVSEYTDSSYGIGNALSNISSEGLLSTIFSAITGAAASSDSALIGNKMSEDEINEMAEYYGVSVSDYLTGLDNGRYLTLSAKNTGSSAESIYNKNSGISSGSSILKAAAGIAGLTGAGVGVSSLLNSRSRNCAAADPKLRRNDHDRFTDRDKYPERGPAPEGHRQNAGADRMPEGHRSNAGADHMPEGHRQNAGADHMPDGHRLNAGQNPVPGRQNIDAVKTGTAARKTQTTVVKNAAGARANAPDRKNERPAENRAADSKNGRSSSMEHGGPSGHGASMEHGGPSGHGASMEHGGPSGHGGPVEHGGPSGHGGPGR